MATPAKEDTKAALKTYENLIRFFTKKELKVKEAVCFDKRVRYFRNDQFVELIKQNHKEIRDILKFWQFEKPIDNDEGVKEFIQDLMNSKLLFRLERLPDDPKYKWPKKLIPSRKQQPDDNAFYSWTITPRTSRVYTFLLIAAIVVICLFQIWPLSLKIAIFYTALVLLYALLGLIVVRLVVYFFFRILGIDFWILPNLFADVGFLDSFRPFLSIERCHDTTTGYIARFIGLVFMAFLFYKLSQEPEILTDYKNMGTQTFDDILEWGVLKLEGKTTETEGYTGRRRPGDDLRKHLEDLLKDEEDTKKAKEKPEPIVIEAEPVQESADDTPDTNPNIDDSERDPVDDTSNEKQNQKAEDKPKQNVDTETETKAKDTKTTEKAATEL